MVSVENIIKISSYLSKIHHVKGRIRVRVNPDIQKEADASGFTLEDVKSLPNRIDGIKTLKINKVIGSMTVTYDNNIFPYHLWEDLLEQRDLDNIAEVLNKLAVEVV